MMLVEDPRGPPQDIRLHPFDVNLENRDLPVNDIIEPSDWKCLVDCQGLLDVAVKADLVLPRQVVRRYAWCLTESDLVNSYLAVQTISGDVPAQDLSVSGHGFDGIHERGWAQRAEP
jgi:hypothetical protein